MKILRRQAGQSRLGHHHLAGSPTLARKAPGNVPERLPSGFWIGKSYDDHARILLDFANYSKPVFHPNQFLESAQSRLYFWASP
jgi:hypothetical protein